MNLVRTVLTSALIVVIAGGTAWARGNGSHSHSHRHTRSLGYYPYGYSSTPAYPNRYKQSCARNPELEECLKERERLLPLHQQPGNASG